jgi:hypothetical protein
MLKSGRRTVHFLLRESMPGGFGAPFRYSLADLRRYFAGLADIQFEIARSLSEESRSSRQIGTVAIPRSGFLLVRAKAASCLLRTQPGLRVFT